MVMRRHAGSLMGRSDVAAQMTTPFAIGIIQSKNGPLASFGKQMVLF